VEFGSKDKKGSPYSITERTVPELIPALGSQPAGDVNHKPDQGLKTLKFRSTCIYRPTEIYHSLFVARNWQHFIDLLKRKNPRFTAFLDSNLHTRLAIVTKNELGFDFPPRNFPKKFRPDPSTFYLVIMVASKHRQTNRQTEKPTPVKT